MKNEITKYNVLVSSIELLLKDSRSKIVREINQTIVITYWHIGRHIIEYEQGGKERAEYGTELLKRLSKDLTKAFGKGYSYRNLRLIRQFYTTFANWQSAIAKFKNSIVPSLSANSPNLKLQLAFAKLTWTHFVRLLSVKNEDERNFYLIETAENNWSVRELNRQINSSLFDRLLLSKDKNDVKTLAEKGQIVENINDALKDPYVLEFLGLEESSKYSESELEAAIINNIEKFLLELGKGFSFVARQQRFSSGVDHFRIDLVFYNRLLKCFVLIDTKIGKITHGDIGQMQMYINYYDREIALEEENPTIGILLCKEKDDFVIEYTLPEDNNQIFAKEYKLYLPKKEELKKLLKKYL
ncbi:MAG: PDDEXK nuclease domain-containing protein [Melioribacteraceae bacterium]|nr:PDDEXK nuclease domain-containing protein [Melioribacteraceae bacterium]MCF8394406.1 PDDEXK nuclease domain-containing protein [Melioribacteraceae bacterium]MCF8417498.1 PDDEXK nuclease domain-containing protein [Melioribacteraceae bacterium]